MADRIVRNYQTPRATISQLKKRKMKQSKKAMTSRPAKVYTYALGVRG